LIEFGSFSRSHVPPSSQQLSQGSVVDVALKSLSGIWYHSGSTRGSDITRRM
jgi:hypothetical protein